MPNDDLDELLDDFASSPLREEELDELLALAKELGNPNLRRLVLELRALRAAAAWAVDHLAAREDAASVDTPLSLLAFFTRDRRGRGPT
jgi:hypothetical protein